MAWLNQKGRKYLTITIQQNGKPRNLYFGRGVAAAIALRTWREWQQNRQLERARWQQLQQRCHRLEQELNAWQKLVELRIRIELLLAGFHQHKRGPWQRRKEPLYVCHHYG